MATITPTHPNIETTQTKQLPSKGLLRATQLLPFLPFSRTTLWNWSKDGRFPAPIKLSSTMTVWRASDVHKWLAEYEEV